MKTNYNSMLLLATGSLCLGSMANGASMFTNASSNGDSAAARTTFYASVGESPDTTEDFDAFADGTLINTQVSGVVFSGGSATIETGDISGSTPAGGTGGALEITESGDDLVLTFTTAVDYFSFRDIDAASIVMTVTFFGGSTEIHTTETTAGSGDSAEFVGFFRNDLPNQILSVSLNGSGAGNNTMGIDTLEFGTIPEPSSTTLLGLGGLALILRRRK